MSDEEGAQIPLVTQTRAKGEVAKDQMAPTSLMVTGKSRQGGINRLVVVPPKGQTNPGWH